MLTPQPVINGFKWWTVVCSTTVMYIILAQWSYGLVYAHIIVYFRIVDGVVIIILPQSPLIMNDSNISVPVDPTLDLNAYFDKYMTDDNINDNPLNLSNIESQYQEIKQLSSIIKPEYTTIHLNIQSLPAKFEKMKLLLSEISKQKMCIDFILLCETFLTDNICHLYNIPGYNLLCNNRQNLRGGVAIYINSKHNFKRREDLEIFVPGQFESLFIEIQSKASSLIVGEIYRVPNTNELISIKRYDTIVKKLMNYKNVIIESDHNFDYFNLDCHRNTEDLLNTFISSGLSLQ